MATQSTTQTTTTAPPPKAATADGDAPIVLDLGSKSRKQIRRLRKGEGKLMDRITKVVDDLKSNGTISGSAQPVIIVVKERAEDSLLSTIGLS